jgi:hypothetical protein
MLILSRSETAEKLWERRSEALEVGSKIIDEKQPDECSDKERRLAYYALAITNRLNKLQ